MAQKQKLDYYDDFNFATESLSSFESDEDFIHNLSSSEDDFSDEEDFLSVQQWCKIDSSSHAPSRVSFPGSREIIRFLYFFYSRELYFIPGNRTGLQLSMK
ncbi:hypothetical protein TNCV_4863971 [Trichonephila clavipes]|nr:hypothetical protein TNCV_4863971 [Trichonephila clavipes]